MLLRHKIISHYCSQLVPAPTLTITGSPIDKGFHTGVPITFTGRAEFSPAVDTQLDIYGSWNYRNPSSETAVKSHVRAVESPRRTMIYESSLTVDPLRADSVTIIFSLSASSQSFIIGTNATTERFVIFLRKMLLL